jgi:hypothetical protein
MGRALPWSWCRFGWDRSAVIVVQIGREASASVPLVRVPGEKLDAEGLRKTCGTDRRATLTRQDGRAGKRDAPSLATPSCQRH